MKHLWLHVAFHRVDPPADQLNVVLQVTARTILPVDRQTEIRILCRVHHGKSGDRATSRLIVIQLADILYRNVELYFPPSGVIPRILVLQGNELIDALPGALHHHLIPAGVTERRPSLSIYWSAAYAALTIFSCHSSYSRVSASKRSTAILELATAILSPIRSVPNPMHP